MKSLVCVSCEGSDTKIVVFSKTKEGVKINKAFSLSMSKADALTTPEISDPADLGMDNLSDDLSFEDIGSLDEVPSEVDSTDVGFISSNLKNIDLNKSEFIPILTEPVVNYHFYEGQKDKNRDKQLENIIADISKNRNVTVRKDYLDYIELDDKSLFSVFIQGENSCVNLVNSLASYNNRRFYKIPTIKNAEASLAHYVTKTNKFFPEDYTLILYTGRDYSKLIFLKGNNLKHIGSTLDVGTQNLHTYDVYFSKILLEMENGNIPRLDNVILCGEDNSENLILSFYGTFPEANVSELKIENLDLVDLEDNTKSKISSFSIPISVGLEYFEEKEKKYRGINILPKYIHENQKMFQFGWHAFIVLPLIFLAAFYFTYAILTNVQDLKQKDQEIVHLNQIIAQNQTISDQITKYSSKISNFGQTQAILDSASSGAEVWSKMLVKVSDFMERRRNFWITKLTSSKDGNIQINGYSLSRSVLTKFTDYNNSSLLNSISYDQLRDQDAFAYTLHFNLKNEMVKPNGP